MHRSPIFRLALLVALASGTAACFGDPSPEPPRPLKERATLVGHEADPFALVFSPDSKTLASAGCGDGTARLWSMRTFKCSFVLNTNTTNQHPGIGDQVRAVAFSPDGKTVAVNATDRSIQFWSTASGKKLDTLTGRTFVSVVLFSPDGKRLATSSNEKRYWNLTTKTWHNTTLEITHPHPPAMAYDAKGRLFIASMEFPDVRTFSVWDVEKGKKLFTSKGHTKNLWCYAFSGDGKLVASAAEDHTVRIWDAATGKNMATFKDHPGRVTCVAFSPDGKVLASAFRDPDVNWRSPGDIRLYEVSTGKVLATIKGHEHQIDCLAFSPDGKWLASGGSDRKIKVWSLPSTWEGVKNDHPKRR